MICFYLFCFVVGLVFFLLVVCMFFVLLVLNLIVLFVDVLYCCVDFFDGCDCVIVECLCVEGVEVLDCVFGEIFDLFYCFVILLCIDGSLVNVVWVCGDSGVLVMVYVEGDFEDFVWCQGVMLYLVECVVLDGFGELEVFYSCLLLLCFGFDESLLCLVIGCGIEVVVQVFCWGCWSYDG